MDLSAINRKAEKLSTHGESVRIPLARGDAGVEQTIGAMRAIIESTDDTGLVRDLAVKITAAAIEPTPGRPARDNRALILAVYDWTMRRVVFKGDTAEREDLRHPDQLVREIASSPEQRTAADCDDVAMLQASILRAMGFRTALIVTGEKAGRPYAHIFAGVIVGRDPKRDPYGSVVPLDPQERMGAGNWPPAHLRRRLRVFVV